MGEHNCYGQDAVECIRERLMNCGRRTDIKMAMICSIGWRRKIQ